MQQIQVSLAKRSYFIDIGENLLNNPDAYFPLKAGESAMVVTNQTLAPLYLSTLIDTLQSAQVKVDHLLLPDGEQFKSLEILNQVFDALIRQHHGRDTTLIALGGGVIGDLTGFAAACYQRGVRFIQIPTSLLAQVDSSVGGKTAVNHPLAKNMIGAFYQPAKVLIDINCLKTLPRRELIAGLAEVVKYAILFDAEFFSWLEQHSEKLLALDKTALTYCITRCCQLKADVVAEDETDQNRRSLLNLGHTFGHAIETHQGYSNWLHGEAVAAGIVMAANTAYLLGCFPLEACQRIKNLLKQIGLPIHGPANMPAEAYLPLIQRDKKTMAGQTRFILPITIGQATMYSNIPDALLLQSISLSATL